MWQDNEHYLSLYFILSYAHLFYKLQPMRKKTGFAASVYSTQPSTFYFCRSIFSIYRTLMLKILSLRVTFSQWSLLQCQGFPPPWVLPFTYVFPIPHGRCRYCLRKSCVPWLCHSGGSPVLLCVFYWWVGQGRWLRCLNFRFCPWLILGFFSVLLCLLLWKAFNCFCETFPYL